MSDEAVDYGGDGGRDYRPTGGEPELRHYLGILRRRIWALLSTFIILTTLGTLYAFKSTPIYQGTAKILIEKQSPRAAQFEDVVEPYVTGQDYYKTQKELVRSRTVLEGALQQPGMAELPEITGEGSQPPLFARILGQARRTVSALLGGEPVQPLEPWEQLRKHLQVEQVRDTHLLLVNVESKQPQRAAQLANAVARSFERYHVTRKLETSHEAFLFLQEQKVKQEEQLREAEGALQEFREQAQVVSLDVKDTQNPILIRLDRLNQQLIRAQLNRIDLEAQLQVVQEALGPPEGAREAGAREAGTRHLFGLPVVRADETIFDLQAELVEHEKELATLTDTYGPQHPQLEAAQARGELLRSKLQEALAYLVDSLGAQLAILINQEAELHQQYEEQNQLALELARQSLTFNRLADVVDRQGQLFRVLVNRMGQVDISAEYARTNVEVVETASIPKAPIKPKKMRTVAVSLFLGLFLGTGLAFFFEYLDDTVKTPADLEDRVGVAVLGFVPDMDTKGVGMDGFSYRGSVCVVEPKGSASEAYRNIRTSLFFSAPPEESQLLVVTSSGPQDGKTTTATNLALVIAQSGKRVLLVDADFRKPMVHKVFGLRSRVGLSTVLVGEASLAEAVQRPEYDGKTIENLDVLAAGPTPPNPAELLDSQGMRQLLAQARQSYDRVIMDTPPVLFVADASIVGAISDGVILVVKSATNTRALATRAREHLEGVRARILGGILNDVHVSRLGYYYSDYYYYGYSRYYRDYYRTYSQGDEEDQEGSEQEESEQAAGDS